MVISYTIHIQEIIDRHLRQVQLRKTTHDRMIESRKKVLEPLAADSDTKNLYDVLMKADTKN